VKEIIVVLPNSQRRALDLSAAPFTDVPEHLGDEDAFAWCHMTALGAIGGQSRTIFTTTKGSSVPGNAIVEVWIE
jgi:hypothetical protein